MNNDVLLKLSKFAFVSTVIGVCTIGICPAFAVIGLAIDIVFKQKKVELSHECQVKMRAARILGIAALVMFVIDIVAAFILFGR